MHNYGTDDWPSLPPMSELVNRVHESDYLDLLEAIPSQSVDLLLTDAPYNTTACEWEMALDYPRWWTQVRRVLKPRAACVMTASQPFTSELVMSNRGMFKYTWVWDKNRGNGHLVAKYRPLQRTEDIVVFANGATVYNPQMMPRETNRKFQKSPTSTSVMTKQVYADDFTRDDYVERFPTNLLFFSWSIRDGLHPTQKPVALFEYLIATYTQSDALVVDPFSGSGTTAIAARNLGRRFICGDITPAYVTVARERLITEFGKRKQKDGDGLDDLPLFATA